MFQVLVREKKRRTISPLFIGASVAAHVLVFGGAIYAASGEPAAAPIVVIDEFPISPVERPVEKPIADAPKPVEQDQPAVEKPVVGETVVIPSPTVIPDHIAPPSPTETPITPDMVTGIGKPGDVIGTPDQTDTRPATGSNTDGDDEPSEEFVLTGEMVEELPRLDQNGLARILERNYPPMLRDARMNGRVVVELVVDRDGRVRPESARVVEASHPAFADATLRAVERFRFRPAKIGGMVVPVKVSIPVVWTAID